VRARLPLAVLVLAVVAGITLLATAGAKGTLTYYKTPSELLSAPATTHPVRLGGLVVAHSVHRHGSSVRFALTDGDKQIEVVTDVAPPSTFRVGQGAVVQGTLGSGEVFHATSVVVRHDNQYRPAEMLRH
jgi:cytochrome c-type biogenesis protein CcmE